MPARVSHPPRASVAGGERAWLAQESRDADDEGEERRVEDDVHAGAMRKRNLAGARLDAASRARLVASAHSCA
jgi:hypothetical protein